MLNTKEHDDLIEQFEKDYKVQSTWAEKNPKHLWKLGHIYCHGPTNDNFIAYRFGYAYGKTYQRLNG